MLTDLLPSGGYRSSGVAVMNPCASGVRVWPDARETVNPNMASPQQTDRITATRVMALSSTQRGAGTHL